MHNELFIQRPHSSPPAQRAQKPLPFPELPSGVVLERLREITKGALTSERSGEESPLRKWASTSLTDPGLHHAGRGWREKLVLEGHRDYVRNLREELQHDHRQEGAEAGVQRLERLIIAFRQRVAMALQELDAVDLPETDRGNSLVASLRILLWVAQALLPAEGDLARPEEIHGAPLAWVSGAYLNILDEACSIPHLTQEDMVRGRVLGLSHLRLSPETAGTVQAVQGLINPLRQAGEDHRATTPASEERNRELVALFKAQLFRPSPAPPSLRGKKFIPFSREVVIGLGELLSGLGYSRYASALFLPLQDAAVAVDALLNQPRDSIDLFDIACLLRSLKNSWEEIWTHLMERSLRPNSPPFRFMNEDEYVLKALRAAVPGLACLPHCLELRDLSHTLNIFANEVLEREEPSLRRLLEAAKDMVEILEDAESECWGSLEVRFILSYPGRKTDNLWTHTAALQRIGRQKTNPIHLFDPLQRMEGLFGEASCTMREISPTTLARIARRSRIAWEEVSRASAHRLLKGYTRVHMEEDLTDTLAVLATDCGELGAGPLAEYLKPLGGTKALLERVGKSCTANMLPLKEWSELSDQMSQAWLTIEVRCLQDMGLQISS